MKTTKTPIKGPVTHRHGNFKIKFEDTNYVTNVSKSRFNHFSFTEIPDYKFSFDIYKKSISDIMYSMIEEGIYLKPVENIHLSKNSEWIVKSIKFKRPYTSQDKKKRSDKDFYLDLYNIVSEREIEIKCGEKIRIIHKDFYDCKRESSRANYKNRKNRNKVVVNAAERYLKQTTSPQQNVCIQNDKEIPLLDKKSSNTIQTSCNITSDMKFNEHMGKRYKDAQNELKKIDEKIEELESEKKNLLFYIEYSLRGYNS